MLGGFKKGVQIVQLSPGITLKNLIEQKSHMPIKELYEKNISLWESLGLNEKQVALWVSSLPKNTNTNQKGTAISQQAELSNYLVLLVKNAGGRMHLAQVLKKLPSGIVTTEQQIKKMASQYPKLAIQGPFLILTNEQ
jgi:hypothetical protein